MTTSLPKCNSSNNHNNNKNYQEDHLILNVGGVRYETFRSTLTAYPRTLLGTMFAESNKTLVRPNESNEYFIDRDGRLFWFIMQYYRTGKALWPQEAHPSSSTLLKNVLLPAPQTEALLIEYDYFQIPIDESNEAPHQTPAASHAKIQADQISGFIASLHQILTLLTKNFEQTIEIIFFYPICDDDGGFAIKNPQGRLHDEILEILDTYGDFGFMILSKFREDIKQELTREFSGLSFEVLHNDEDGYSIICLDLGEQDEDEIRRLLGWQQDLLG